jgi:hypothetical protein
VINAATGNLEESLDQESVIHAQDRYLHSKVFCRVFYNLVVKYLFSLLHTLAALNLAFHALNPSIKHQDLSNLIGKRDGW